MFHTNQIFLKNLIKNNKNLNIYLNENNFYYLSLHIKLSSLFYSTQLIEILAYEIPTNKNQVLFQKENKTLPIQNNLILIYNFHCILTQQRFFIFLIKNFNKNINKKNIQ
jgi:hypothetical protein